MSKAQSVFGYLCLIGGTIFLAFTVIAILQIPSGSYDVDEFPETDLFIGDCVAGEFFHSPSETSELRIGTVTGFFAENFELNVVVRLTSPESFGYRNYISVDDSSLRKISLKYCRVLE